MSQTSLAQLCLVHEGAPKRDETYEELSDGRFLGYLNAYPDHWTQGDDFEEPKAQPLDLYHEFAKDDLPGVRKVGELVVA